MFQHIDSTNDIYSSSDLNYFTVLVKWVFVKKLNLFPLPQFKIELIFLV
jgi:hypothetical protein